MSIYSVWEEWYKFRLAWVVSATHFPVSGPASLECSTVAGTPTLILWRAAGWSICIEMNSCSIHICSYLRLDKRCGPGIGTWIALLMEHHLPQDEALSCIETTTVYKPANTSFTGSNARGVAYGGKFVDKIYSVPTSVFISHFWKERVVCKKRNSLGSRHRISHVRAFKVVKSNNYTE